MIEGRWRLNRAVGFAFMDGAVNRSARAGFLRGEPGLVEDIDKPKRFQSQPLDDLQTFPIALFNPRRNRRGDPFPVVVEIAAALFDPTRVAQHTRWMHDGVYVRESRFQHVLG